jgi:hypothetical protein
VTARLVAATVLMVVIGAAAGAQSSCPAGTDPRLCETRIQRDEALDELADVAARLSDDEQRLNALKIWWAHYMDGLARHLPSGPRATR